MSFETDKQTLDDLNILGKYKNNSVYSLFKDVKTRGGERLLEQMFTNPLCDAKEINERADIFKRFQGEVPAFPVDCNLFDSVEQYLSGISDKSALVLLMNLWKMKSLEIIGNNPHLSLLREQVAATLSFLKVARIYLDALSKVVKDCPLEERVTQGVQLLQRKELEDLVNINEAQSMNDLFRCEKVLRNTLNAPLNALLKLFYELDVATMVGQVARERNFCFATANVEQEVSIGIKGLFHPCLTKAIANDIEITKKKNIFFLTGANMAGKSTLMKSFGIAVYMAHLGFPVAAQCMNFAVQNGIYTSINVPDNIFMGYSHFYAEVLRVKKVAIEVSKSKRLVVIFDELFKGTNVKDAYDATLAVTSALAKRQECSFMISTHIIEVGENLRKRCENVSFGYLPTIMKNNVPTYTYRLTEGITNDKHGMLIIQNEHIVDIIRNRKIELITNSLKNE